MDDEALRLAGQAQVDHFLGSNLIFFHTTVKQISFEISHPEETFYKKKEKSC